MKITKSQLKKIIKEELSKALNEGYRSGPTDPVDGGSGFSSDPRQRTPEEERAHKAQVAADRAKEEKGPKAQALAWLGTQPEEEEQAADYARMNAEDHKSYQQLYAKKALELYHAFHGMPAT